MTTEKIDTERALKESEERNRLISSLIADYVFKFNVDENNNILLSFLSENFHEITGRKPDDISDINTWTAIFHPDDYPGVRQFVNNLLTGSTFREMECRSVVRGEIRWIRISAQPETDKVSGRVISVTGAVKDISGMKTAEQELRQSEEKFRSLVENALVGVFTVDDAFQIIYVNDEVCRIAGRTRKELLGMDFRKVLSSDSVDLVVGRYIRRQRGEQVPLRYDIEIIRGDGQIRQIEMLVTVMEDNSGRKRSMGQLIDISERKKIENELRASESRLRSFIEESMEGIVIADENGVITEWNHKAGSITGIARENALGRCWWDITYEMMPPDRQVNLSRDVLEKMTTAILRTGEVDRLPQGIYPIRHKNGEIRYLEQKEFTFKTDAGYRIAAILTDVTEKRITENALKKSEEKFRGIAQNIPGMVFQFYARRDGQQGFNYISDQSLKYLGIDNKNVQDIYRHFLEGIVEEDRRHFLGSVQKAIVQMSRWQYEGKFRRPDGNILYFRGVAQPRQVEQEIWFDGLILDITERKIAQEKLQESEQLYRSIVELAPDGITLINLQGKILKSNNQMALLLGYDNAENLTGMQVQDLIAPEFQSTLLHDARMILEGRVPAPMLYEYIRKDGTRFTGEYRGSVVFDSRGIPVAHIGMVTDITERKKAEAEILKLNQELERKVEERTAKLHEAVKDLESFAYSVSHDLRAPVRHIDGFVRLLYTNIDKPSDLVTGYFEKIKNASQHMSSMISSLLEFSRLGRKELTLSTIDLMKVVSEVTEALKPDIEKRNIRWNIMQLPEIKGDRNLIKLAFENLISNAIKYTAQREEAVIEIGSKVLPENQVEIYFRDNGTGFDMTYASKLFGVFQRLHNADQFEGIGIGLANVRQIVEKHKGTVRAEGQTDKGAVFYITLPKT